MYMIEKVIVNGKSENKTVIVYLVNIIHHYGIKIMLTSILVIFVSIPISILLTSFIRMYLFEKTLDKIRVEDRNRYISMNITATYNNLKLFEFWNWNFDRMIV